MTAQEGRHLRVNDRVRWAPDGALGTVREVTYHAVKIEWEDGKWALMPFADENAPWQNLQEVR